MKNILRALLVCLVLILLVPSSHAQILSEHQARQQYMMRKKAAEMYNDAARLYEAEEYEMAFERFKQAQKISPDYDRSKYYLRQIEEDLKDPKRQAELIRERDEKREKSSLRKKAKTLYRQAERLYKEDANVNRQSDATEKTRRNHVTQRPWTKKNAK